MIPIRWRFDAFNYTGYLEDGGLFSLITTGVLRVPYLPYFVSSYLIIMQNKAKILTKIRKLKKKKKKKGKKERKREKRKARKNKINIFGLLYVFLYKGSR